MNFAPHFLSRERELISEMADKKMPPELLAHFKKKQEDKEGSDKESKMSDKEKRKDALSKARKRMEDKKKKDWTHTAIIQITLSAE